MEAFWQAVRDGVGHLSFWKCVGWMGNVVFFSRFIVQWFYTEKRKQVVVPSGFWWLSLAGSLLLFSYGVHVGDYVFILAYAFTWIPYVRNLMIHRRHKAAQITCGSCETMCVPTALYCHHCGIRLVQTGRA